MNNVRRFWRNIRKTLRFKVEDPISFREVWSFNSTGLRVLSLFLILTLLFTLAILFLFSSLFVDWRGQGNVSIERKKLEKQSEIIEHLSKRVDDQEQYINAIRLVYSNEIPLSAEPDSLLMHAKLKKDSLTKSDRKLEEELAKKVAADSRQETKPGKLKNEFISPVNGVISQPYSAKTHPGVDIVSTKDAIVKAIADGTVLYSGYSRQDGNILILDHGNGYVSVFKHNRSILKKTGSKVRLGDPVAIVGDTGSHSEGAHLHFELWRNGQTIDPAKHMKISQ